MNNIKITFILGTRPEILKLTSVIKQARSEGIKTSIIHTGQHYDHNMSSIFFDDLNLPEPDIFIGVGSGDQGYQTGKGILEIEKFLIKDRPDFLAVVGDTNAGVSGAIAAVKLGIPVVHYEAGSRSYDWTMPEEINRRLIDSISRFCFAPTKLCLERLIFEGRGKDSFLVGDTLVESATEISNSLGCPDKILNDYSVDKDNYGLLTIHRGDNTDNINRLTEILSALNAVDYPVLFPIHPRTKKKIKDFNLYNLTENIKLIDPLPYSSFMQLIKYSRFVVTDSGGVQQEAAIFKKHSLTIRNNTEWMETVYEGGNKLVRAKKDEILESINDIIFDKIHKKLENPFKLGASKRSLELLKNAKIDGSLAYPSSDFFGPIHDDYII